MSVLDEARQRAGARSPGHQAPDEWPSPVPLVVLPEVPTFPVDVLPDWMRDYVRGLAVELQVPLDLPALLVLTVASAGIARKVVVTPRPGWEKEPTNLYSMVVLPPGEKKSQTFRKVLRPVTELETELQERERPKVERAESDFKVAELRVHRLQQEMAKANSPEDRATLTEELTRALEARQSLVVPAIPLLSVDDDTPDKLAMELANQGGRLLVASAEAKALENISLYGDQSNFDVYLKGHPGDDMKSGRVGRGRQAVKKPALSALFTPQPHVLEMLGANEALRGRGFLARWIYALPQSLVGYRDVDPPAMAPALQQRYIDRMKALWRTEYVTGGLPFEPHELKTTDEARQEIVVFLEWIEVELRPGGQLSGMAGWGAKLSGLTARLCGVLHVASQLEPHGEWCRQPIDVETVRAAIAIARDFAVGHARAAFALMSEDLKVAQAKKVLKWMKSRDIPLADFNKRDCFCGCRGTFKTVEDLEPVLDLLERHSLIRQQQVERKIGPGRSPSPTYSVNPAAFIDEPTAHNPQNSNALLARAHSAESAYSAKPIPVLERERDSPALRIAECANSARTPGQLNTPVENVLCATVDLDALFQ